MSDGAKLSSGYIDLTVKYGSAMKKIAADFNGIQGQAEQAGKQAGGALSKGLGEGTKNAGKQIQRQLTGDSSKIGMLVGRSIGEGINTALPSSARGAIRNLADVYRRDGAAAAAGTAIGKTIGTSLKAGLVTAAGAGVAAVGYTLIQGFQRLEKIDQARFKLQALGNSAESVNEIMKNAEASVKGTAFALDEAASSAASAVAAGIKPGQQLTEYLSTISDTAAIAGTSFSDMASIFNKVTTNNKAYTDDLQMLADRGIPIFQYLRDEYNVSAEELQKMVEDGKVSAQDFGNALETHIGGASKKMGESFSGAMSNMHAAVARLGANFLATMFGSNPGQALSGPTDAVNAFTAKLNEASRWVTAHGPEIHQFFVDAKNVAGDVATAVGDISRFLRDNKTAVELTTEAFLAWKALQFTGLLSGLGRVSDLLGAKGGSGILGKLGVAVAMVDIINRFQDRNGGDPNAGPDFGQQALDAGTGALLGGQIAGVPGALAGGLIGSAVGPATDYLGPPTPSANGVLPPGMPGATNSNPNWNPITGNIDPRTGQLPPGGGGRGLNVPGQADAYLDSKAVPLGSGQGGAESWRPAVRATLQAYGGRYGITNMQAWEDAMIRQIATESGGNPTAVNNWDSNAKAGHPSQGLLQFIPSTFAAHNITGGAFTDPMAQIAAFLPYVMQRYGVDANGAPLQVGRGIGYDEGGWLKPGTTVAVNNSGQDELILTGDQASELLQGRMDPSSSQHGISGGQLPGPPASVGKPEGGNPAADLLAGDRTQGYIPAGAGNSSVAGTSFLSGLYGMGAEVINGVIDQGAALASTAATAAIAAGTMGAGAAGAPAAGAAAQFAIGIGTQAAKRGVQYGAQMLGIGTDALLEQLSPFGMPRWLTTDVTGFMPQQGIMQAATTSIEKAFQQGNQPPQGPGTDPVSGMPGQPHGMPGQPGTSPLGPPPGPPQPDPGAPQQPPTPSPGMPQQPQDLLSYFGIPAVYDEGGWLEPGGIAINKTKTVEPMAVFNDSQWDTMASIANAPIAAPDPKAMGGVGDDFSVHIHSVTVKDVAELERQMKDRQTLQTMRYRGRPSSG